jgi:hypothetical protein
MTNARTAFQKQIEVYRQMTGEQRLQIVLNLHEMSCGVAREEIRAQYPDASPEEVEKHLPRRFALAQRK